MPPAKPGPEPASERGPLENSRVPEGGTPTRLAAIQDNASRLNAQPPSTSRESVVERWINVGATYCNSPQTVAWVPGDVPPTAGSHQHRANTYDSRRRPELVLHLRVPLYGFNETSLMPAPPRVPPSGTRLPGPRNDNADLYGADDVPSLTTGETSSGESSIPPPPPATRPMVARPNVIAGEMTEEENRAITGRAASAA